MASVTITTTAPEDARIAPAFGDFLGLGRNATAPEVKTALVAFLKNTVLSYEQQQAAKQAVAATTAIAPT